MANNELVISTIELGQHLPELKTGPIQGDALRRMAKLLKDPNPIHWDLEYARARGLREVIQQGNLNMLPFYLLIENWVGNPEYLKEIKGRFLGNVFKGDITITSGTVTNIKRGDKLITIEIDIEQRNAAGEKTCIGMATVTIPSET